MKTIKLSAIVTDTGIPQLSSTADITIDVININDNDPIFDTDIYNFTVRENSPRGTIVGQIRANDMDDGKDSIFCLFVCIWTDYNHLKGSLLYKFCLISTRFAIHLWHIYFSHEKR